MSKFLPIARNTNIVSQDFEKEVLLYDLEKNNVYCLNETSKIVWQHCDGHTEKQDLALKYNLTEDLIELAIYELQKNNLLQTKVENQAPTNRIERRKFIKRAGAATLAVMPIISVVVAPTAAQTLSNGCLACYTGSVQNPIQVPPECRPAPNSQITDPFECGTYCGAICCGVIQSVSFDIRDGSCVCLATSCA